MQDEYYDEEKENETDSGWNIPDADCNDPFPPTPTSFKVSDTLSAVVKIFKSGVWIMSRIKYDDMVESIMTLSLLDSSLFLPDEIENINQMCLTISKTPLKWSPFRRTK